MTDNNEIKKGEEYRTISDEDYHSGTILIVKKVTGQSNDDFVYWVAKTPIKYKRRYNKGKSRVWWFREYCRRVN